MRIFSVFGFCLTASLMFGLGSLPVSAASPLTGLLQGPNSLYWVTNYQKRYLFPPEDQSVLTWNLSPQFAKIAAPTELAKSPLVDIVHFKPGSLAAVATSNQLYAVARHGVLRPITNQAVARQVFPNTNLAALPKIGVTQVANYHIGKSVMSAADFKPTDEAAGIQSPDDNQPLSPTELATDLKNFEGALTLSISRDSSGSPIAKAVLSKFNSPVSSITIVLSNQSNIPLKGCVGRTECEQAIVGDYALGTTSILAKATNELGQVVTSAQVKLP